MPFCEVAAGTKLYYEDFGEGPALVFTPSGSLTHKMWGSQVAALAGEYRTVAYDWRGTGASDKPRGGFTAENATADLCALIERLGLAPAVLVSHGIGTHPTLLAASTRPDLVAGLVLASAAPWFGGLRDGAPGGLSQEFLDFLADANGPAMTYAQFIAELSARLLFHREQPPAVHHSLLEEALTWPPYVMNAYAKSLAAIDHRERLARIECPTLVIHGRHDRKVRHEGAVYLATQIKGARLVTLENSAHMGQIEEIAAFNGAVESFLAGIRARKRAA
jgi:pimeloyl-ACP methyl ester carboxylesterase